MNPNQVKGKVDNFVQCKISKQALNFIVSSIILKKRCTYNIHMLVCAIHAYMLCHGHVHVQVLFCKTWTCLLYLIIIDTCKSPQECATFFLESSREKIKHAIAALLVEILYPVAAVINVEASLPVIKRFVAMLYNQCFEQARKGRHSTQTVSWLSRVVAPRDLVSLSLSLSLCYMSREGRKWI